MASKTQPLDVPVPYQLLSESKEEKKQENKNPPQRRILRESRSRSSGQVPSMSPQTDSSTDQKVHKISTGSIHHNRATSAPPTIRQATPLSTSQNTTKITNSTSVAIDYNDPKIYPTGTVTVEQATKIGIVLNTFLLNSDVFTSTLVLMERDISTTQPRFNIINTQLHIILSYPQHALLEEFAKQGLETLKKAYNGLYSDFLLEIAIKMALVQKTTDLLKQVYSISPCYIGNLLKN